MASTGRTLERSRYKRTCTRWNPLIGRIRLIGWKFGTCCGDRRWHTIVIKRVYTGSLVGAVQQSIPFGESFAVNPVTKMSTRVRFLVRDNPVSCPPTGPQRCSKTTVEKMKAGELRMVANNALQAQLELPKTEKDLETLPARPSVEDGRMENVRKHLLVEQKSQRRR